MNSFRLQIPVYSLIRFTCLCALVSLVPALVRGQTAIPMGSPMPTNPSAILALAEGANGLSSRDLKPWHLKASYQTFNESGQPADTGVFEEWWAGPKEYKQSYTSKSFTETTYVTDTGTYKTGESGFMSLAESLLADRLLSPVQEPDKDVVLMRRTQDFGTTQLDCVVLARKMSNLMSAPSALFPTYCFEADRPILRWGGSYGQCNSLYNRIVIFQGKYVAEDLSVLEGNNVSVLTAHIDALSLLENVNHADFIPPKDATRSDTPAPITRDAAVMQGYVLHKVAPQYPASAKESRIEGTVRLRAEIGADGHMHEMTVLSAPDPSLAIASMLAVRQWQYKPYLLNGRPVRVETQITVIFKLG